MTTNNHAEPHLQIWGEEVQMKIGTYANGGTAVALETTEGEPFGTISVWFPESPRLPRDVVYVKDWAENKPLISLLVDTGLIVPAPEHPEVQSGWVTAQTYRVPSVTAQMQAEQDEAEAITSSTVQPGRQQRRRQLEIE